MNTKQMLESYGFEFKKKTNDGLDSYEHKELGLVIWIDKNRVDSSWKRNGSYSLAGRYNDKVVSSVLIEDIIDNVDNDICIECGEIKEIVGSHFAGNYCDYCYENYKSRHTGKCLICGKPRYICHC